MSGNDANTVLLLHCNGIDESTDFPDDSVGGTTHELTAHGEAQVDTALKKFGTGSAYFDGSGNDYLTAPDHADWTFGSDDFTVDFWIYHLIDNRLESVVAHWGTGSIGWTIATNHSGTHPGEFYIYWKDADGDQYNINVGSYPLNEWAHVAFVRSGDTLYIYGNGIRATVGTITGAMNNSTGPITIGMLLSSQWFTGYLDELRISKGIARWTAESFDVPTKEYSEVPPGWTGKLLGVTNPAKVMGIAVANISKVMGV